MASTKGASSPSAQQSISTDLSSSSTAQHLESPIADISPQQLSTNPVSGIKSPISFLSPQTSRDNSPSRQWLSPYSVLQSKENVQKAGVHAPALLRSASMPGQVVSASTTTPASRSSSTLDATSMKPTPLSEAVNNLWKLQKEQGTSDQGVISGIQSINSNFTSVKDNSRAADLSTSDSRVAAPTGIHDIDGTLDSSVRYSASSQLQNNSAVRASRVFNAVPTTLETVDEGEHSSPSPEPHSSASSFSQYRESVDLAQGQITSDINKDDTISLDGGDGASLSRVSTANPQLPHGRKEKSSEVRRESASRSAFPISRRPLTSLVSTKVRGTTDTSQSMIVETETVPSIPQTFISSAISDRTGYGRRDESGTLGRRSSNETIKPRKEKKKSVKKAPSMISGTASSRADLFEAKIASAVDEDSSDSEETFVYESNPPEPRARHRSDHSRTPSVNSMQSLGDRRGGRYGHYLDGSRRIRGQRSMKFASGQYNNGGVDDESGDGGTTPRASHARAGLLGEIQTRHLGAYDRGSIRDYSNSERNSPFSQALKTRGLRSYDFRDFSKPQTLNRPSSRGSTTKKTKVFPYEMGRSSDDNERTPLIGSIRAQRLRASRDQRGSDPERLEFYEAREMHWLSRIAGCCFMCLIVLLFVMGASAFIFATTKPLFDLSIKQVENVLASEQEIMLDLLVQAINPNIISITVSDMDINIFAKSTHVGGDNGTIYGDLAVKVSNVSGVTPRKDDSDLRGIPRKKNPGSIDRGTDAIIEDPSSDPHTMLLGEVFEFDSPLMFDASPWRHIPQNSSGELRLRRPGNWTEVGGSDKWERVVQHQFELVVRGILKYKLPLSSRIFTASVGASVIVHPEAGIDGGGSMKLVKVRKAFWEA